ncbi:hypothetical protein [Azohydromonas caseinilytica]|uniref:Uncharacterized protein n=1 Tax=Azohydromonas caseinilytica TaxID=2728836 RepID=A0A848FDF1_9BURK|nr:hypothetical protein [Azohydromonas caseinilytica]NML17026.1 hypothetical protein [Azohydromonas caseinilytica]
MFGSKAWYIASYPLTLVVLLLYTQAMASDAVFYNFLNIYFVAGIGITIFMRFKDNTQWEKLSFADKGYFYVVHAWYWPWSILRHFRGHNNK